MHGWTGTWFAGDDWNLDVSGGFATPLAAELIRAADVVVAWGASLNMWTSRHGSLIGPDTVVLTAMNGVPWWFFDRLSFGNGKLRLESLDPGGRLMSVELPGGDPRQARTAVPLFRMPVTPSPACPRP